jgi:hypothetical protein
MLVHVGSETCGLLGPVDVRVRLFSFVSLFGAMEAGLCVRECLVTAFVSFSWLVHQGYISQCITPYIRWVSAECSGGPRHGNAEEYEMEKGKDGQIGSDETDTRMWASLGYDRVPDTMSSGIESDRIGRDGTGAGIEFSPGYKHARI